METRHPRSLTDAIIYFKDYENCRRFMIEMRWPDGVVRCPTCNSEKVTYLVNARRWKCYSKHWRPQFTLKVGTIFEDSPLPLEKWLPAMWLLSNCKNGISSYELAKNLGIRQQSAWFMLHRIREAMKQDTTQKFGFGGPVESDETYVGPNPAKMHKSRKARVQARDGHKGGYVGKTAVHGMLDRELRMVRAKVMPNVRREDLQNAILENVTPFAKVYTDEFSGYDDLSKGFVHKVVNHSREYVNGQVHTQGIENFWSLLKRTLRGTYVAVEPFHLDAYIDEQVFRFNNRATKDNKLTDTDRFVGLMAQVAGKRLTYAQLTGKDSNEPHHPEAGTGQEEQPF
jgi:transposase-like protein